MKAQVKIISALLIILIGLALASMAYMWGKPLIEKREHTAIVERVRGTFDQTNPDSLPRRIEAIARARSGEELFKLDVAGIWTVHPHDEPTPQNNSIEFTFASWISDVALANETARLTWFSRTEGVICPWDGSGPSAGRLGIDSPSVVCVRADMGERMYNITYRVWFRTLCEELVDGQCEGEAYKIELLAPDVTSSTRKTFRISFAQIQQVGRLIRSQINIHL
jgi:hypothetical protein